MSDKGEDWVVDGSEIDPEEHKRYLARLGNIAHRYPIRDIWDVMSDMSIEGAALYSLGIDPDAIQREMEWPEDNDLERLPGNYQERLSIIKSAVRTGAIKRVKVNGSDPGGCRSCQVGLAPIPPPLHYCGLHGSAQPHGCTIKALRFAGG